MDRQRSTADDKARVLPMSRNQLTRRRAPKSAHDEERPTGYVAGGDGTQQVDVKKADDDE